MRHGCAPSFVARGPEPHFDCDQVATSLPCLVPEGWIEDADEPGAGESSAERNAATVIVPPRADRMEVGGRRA